jgi:phosphoserine phosphatase
VQRLAERCGQTEVLAAWLDRADADAATRSQRIAELFRFVHRRQFEAVAREMPLRRGVVKWINAVRRAGFMVGVVSDSYFVAAEVLRRRVFADFALAQTLQFRNEVCTGELRLNPAFLPPDGTDGAPDKRHVLERLRPASGLSDAPAFTEAWAVGDHLNDLGLLRAADRALVVEPKHRELRAIDGIVEFLDFDELNAAMRRGGWLAAGASRTAAEDATALG